MLTWCKDTAIVSHFIAPGKPIQNAFVERFNGMCEFLKRDATLWARRCTERAYRMGLDYNGECPHTSLKYRPAANAATFRLIIKRIAMAVQRLVDVSCQDAAMT
jgi:transposase InsO family protein